MELPISQEGDDMPIGPIPLNSTYGGGSHAHGHGHSPHPHPHPHVHAHGHGHIIHHDHTIIPASSAAAAPLTITTNNHIPSNGPTISDDDDDDHDNIHHHHHNMAVPAFKKMIRYRECLKNHAASMGGNATDGCGEFMPSGEEGTIEALTCSACNCHRNFHRKEIEGDPQNSCEITNCYHGNVVNPRMPRKLFMGHHHKPGSFMAPAEAIGYHAGLISSRPHQMIMSYNMGGGGGGGHPSESDDPEDGGGGGGGGGGMMMRPIQNKKRFRTKFTQEQKEKMLSFAEKVGWKIQKQEEGVVQQFCQEVGVKRRVLKVWMHNNKHNLAKKNPQSDPQSQSQSQSQV